MSADLGDGDREALEAGTACHVPIRLHMGALMPLALRVCKWRQGSQMAGWKARCCQGNELVSFLLLQPVDPLPFPPGPGAQGRRCLGRAGAPQLRLPLRLGRSPRGAGPTRSPSCVPGSSLEPAGPPAAGLEANKARQENRRPPAPWLRLSWEFAGKGEPTQGPRGGSTQCGAAPDPVGGRTNKYQGPTSPLPSTVHPKGSLMIPRALLGLLGQQKTPALSWTLAWGGSSASGPATPGTALGSAWRGWRSHALKVAHLGPDGPHCPGRDTPGGRRGPLQHCTQGCVVWPLLQSARSPGHEEQASRQPDGDRAREHTTPRVTVPPGSYEGCV